MLVRATKTAVSDSDKDFVAVEMVTMGDSLNDAPIWGAFVDDEFDAVGRCIHAERSWVVIIDGIGALDWYGYYDRPLSIAQECQVGRK